MVVCRLPLVLLVWGCGRVGFDRFEDGECNGAPVTWTRSIDWMLGVNPGTTDGNPGVDSTGHPVWYYEATMGGPLGAADAWYAQPATRLVWDSSWFGQPGMWVTADDVGPPIAQYAMTHIVRDSSYPVMPRVRWSNAYPVTIDLEIAGRLRVRWQGDPQVAVGEVDAVIAALDVSGAPTTVFEMTVSKPTPDNTTMESVDIEVPSHVIRVAPAQSLVVSVRGRFATTWVSWVLLVDELVLTGRLCE